MIGNSIDQLISINTISLLVSANWWPIDDHTQTVHQLLSIGSATSNRCHICYLSDQPPFLGSPGDEIGNKNSDPVFSTQRIYPVACALKLPTCPSLPFCVKMSTQDVLVDALLNIHVRCITILQQLMLLLLAISLFAKVQLLSPECFCEGTMPPLCILTSIDWHMEP